jgi:hypothetical protein
MFTKRISDVNFTVTGTIFMPVTRVVTTQVFGEENPTPCTLVIVPRSVALTYKTHYRIISFPYNEIRVQYRIFTSENNSVYEFSTSPLG